MLPLAFVAFAVAGDIDVAQLRKATFPVHTVDPTRGLGDLAPLVVRLKRAKVVGLGEVTHGSAEVFRAKHRLFRLLVEKLGYRVLALEASMTAVTKIDDYVLNGQGTATDGLKATGFWTLTTTEVRDMIEWMRRYNMNPSHKTKLRVVGIDAQDNSTLWPQLAERLKGYGLKGPVVSDPFMWRQRYTYEERHEEFLKTVGGLIKDLTPAIRAKDGEEGVKLVNRLLEAVRQADAVVRVEILREDIETGMAQHRTKLEPAIKGARAFASAHPALPKEAKDGLEALASAGEGNVDVSFRVLAKGANALEKYGEGRQDEHAFTETAEMMKLVSYVVELRSMPLLPRDKYLAENVLWISRTFLPGQKIAVWAHNSHVSRYRMNEAPLMMGAYLAESLKSDYYPLATAFREGSFNAIGNEGQRSVATVGAPKAGSFDALLASVSPKPFYLDFAKLPTKERIALSLLIPWRSVGSSYRASEPDRYYEPLPPVGLFDGVLFLPKLTAAKLLP